MVLCPCRTERQGTVDEETVQTGTRSCYWGVSSRSQTQRSWMKVLLHRLFKFPVSVVAPPPRGRIRLLAWKR